MDKISWGQIAVLLAVVATLVMNALANAIPLNGLTTGEISDGFDVLFTPAGYVFAIWGLIYIALVAFGIYQALPGQRDSRRLGEIRGAFIVSSAANIAWLLAWHYQRFPLSMLAMLTLLISLMLIYSRLEIGERGASSGGKWFVNVPMSLYLGWISVATIANAAIVLTDLGWGGWGLSDVTWTILMLVVAAGLGSYVALTRGDVTFVLVIIWAFVGIGVRQFDRPIIATTSFALDAILALIFLWAGYRRLQTGGAGGRAA
jgi:hypothetical protein